VDDTARPWVRRAGQKVRAAISYKTTVFDLVRHREPTTCGMIRDDDSSGRSPATARQPPDPGGGTQIDI
jgi:hypothetical protein